MHFAVDLGVPDYTKECIRTVRRISEDKALDYLNCKSDGLRHIDPEKSRQNAMNMFLDEKSFRPRLGEFKRT